LEYRIIFRLIKERREWYEKENEEKKVEINKLSEEVKILMER